MWGRENYTNNQHVNAQTKQVLSKSDIFGILQNERRRYMLEILSKKGEQSIRSLSAILEKVYTLHFIRLIFQKWKV